MADETPKEDKTEDATPRRQQEARAKGQVAMSTEIVAAIMLIVTGGTLAVAGGALAEATGGTVVAGLADVGVLGVRELQLRDYAELLTGPVFGILPALLLVIVPSIVVGAVVAYGQVGFQITPKAIEFDLSKINPVKGFGRLFSLRSVVRTLLAATKIVVIMATLLGVAWSQIGNISVLAGVGVGEAIRGVGYVLMRCSAAGVIAFVAIAVMDLVYQRSQHEKDLRMSKKEVKEELKSTDGDPHVKARIRQIQRELSSRRMMEAVPKATVVVTNPTHFAVALQYDSSEEGEAPRVVAKGVDHVAQKIKAVAREAGVLCYEDRTLARALHAQVEIGDQIPEVLFRAVASVLAFVYGIQGRAVRS